MEGRKEAGCSGKLQHHPQQPYGQGEGLSSNNLVKTQVNCDTGKSDCAHACASLSDGTCCSP